MKAFKISLLLVPLLCMGSYVHAQGTLKPFGELAVTGPYGVGIGAGVFYDQPGKIQYIKGFWGGAAFLLDDETDEGNDYTEKVLDLHGGVSLNSSEIPGLNKVPKLRLFGGVSIAQRYYEHQGDDRTETKIGPVAGATYQVSNHWTLGGMISTTTNDPRFIFSYSF